MYIDNYSNANVASSLDYESASSSPEPIEPLAAIIDGITLGTDKALSMTHQINRHLFGIGESCREEGKNPQCVRDVMVHQRQSINELCCELEKIVAKLGL